ncbi:MAG TPA: MerR family transcriptional regulator [Acidobacteriaceae bacterium]|nr:MerR family transcriptional regulator [Acidobacteriaceae bacterium]
MAQPQPARRKMQSVKTPVSIPDKLYFRIGDVATLCSLPAYVLRFWETEFPQLKPHKGGSGQRLYRKRDVEIVLEIKRLLYDEGFTIAGARKSLAEKRATLTAVDSQSGASQSGTAPHPMRRKTDFITPPQSTKGGRGTGIAAVGSKPVAVGPKFNELRKEMRALLSMLGSDESNKPAASHSAVASVPIPRKKKDREFAEEPTLF